MIIFPKDHAAKAQHLFKNVLDVQSTDKHIVFLNRMGNVHVLQAPERIEDIHLKDIRKLAIPGKTVQITAGARHCACLLEDGRVFVWGGFQDPEFQFGHRKFDPVQILEKEKCVEIASGRDHLLILTQRGDVYSIGCGIHGQLGRVSERYSKSSSRRSLSILMVPRKVHKKRNHFVDKIWASGDCSYYKDNGSDEVFTFGDNSNQKLAPSTAGDQKLTSIFHPVKSRFRDVVTVCEKLVLTKKEDVFACPVSDQSDKWIRVKSLQFIEAIKHCRNGNTYLMNSFKDLLEWDHNEQKPSKIDLPVFSPNNIVQVESINQYLLIIT